MKKNKLKYVEYMINSCEESGSIFQVLRMLLLGIQAKTVLVCYVV